MNRPVRVALWLWVGLLGSLLFAVAVVGMVFMLDPEPRYHAFRRSVNRELAHLKPLPEGLVIVDEWEECGRVRTPCATA